MSETLYTISAGVYVFKTLAAYNTAVSAGMIPTGAPVGFDAVGMTVWSGAGAPTSSTACLSVGDAYYDTTNDCFYECKAIVPSGSAFTFTWKQCVHGAKIGTTGLSLDAAGNITIPLANSAAGSQVTGAVHANNTSYGLTIDNGQIKINKGDWTKFTSQTPDAYLPIVSADFLLGLKKYLGVAITSGTSNTTISSSEADTMREAIDAAEAIEVIIDVD